MFYRNEIVDDGVHRPAPRKHYYPWHQLEEYHPDGGMWAMPGTTERRQHIEAAEQLMAQPEQFREAMLLALEEWPRSCSVALGNPSLNHRAWIGHAGCYIATGSPEETTRLGWHNLDAAEQWAANAAADEVIDTWHSRRKRAQQLSLWDALPSLRTFMETQDA